MAFSFAVNDEMPHDLLIEDNQIQTVSDNELFAQKLQAVWNTNKGEWSLDPSEGIDFRVVLKKGYEEDEIRDELSAALSEVSEDAELVGFELVTDKKTRHAAISATVLVDGEEVDVPLEF